MKYGQPSSSDRASSVLIVGPLPPPAIGPAIATRRFMRSEVLRSRFDVVHLNTSDPDDPGGIGRLSWHNIAKAFRHAGQCLKILLVSHPDVASARAGRASSPWFRSLDGTWRFAGFERAEEVRPAHVADATDTAGWRTITVPGHWTLQGFDHPHYTNVQMPFTGRPPDVPERNPTGVYRTTFRLPVATCYLV